LVNILQSSVFPACFLIVILYIRSEVAVLTVFIKIFFWYDNEWGYSCRIVDLIEYISNKGI
jgi:glyceraldehyde-3-phosphate dehydrogenase/erythrose-4-phosphate dehydrogenase